MNTRTTAHKTVALLRALGAQIALTLLCQCTVAAGAGPEAGTDVAPTAAAAMPTPAAQLVALNPRESVVRNTVAARAQPRLGMHLVLRLAVVDIVSHPDSGNVDFALRSRMLNRSIARAPLAVGVAWRF